MEAHLNSGNPKKDREVRYDVSGSLDSFAESDGLFCGRGSAVSQEAQCAALREAIDSRANLTERERDAVVLHYLRGMSWSMVARMQGIAIGAVRIHASRALAKIRRSLGSDFMAVLA